MKILEMFGNLIGLIFLLILSVGLFTMMFMISVGLFNFWTGFLGIN